MSGLPPLLFEPVYQSYLWGGDRMAVELGRKGTPTPCAESWEVSDRPEGASVAHGGPLAGRSLPGLLREHRMALLGTRCKGESFPLLLKLIDASQTLSVQVHPDDAGAAAHGGEAKTEMWYILGATPGACVYCGLQPGVDRAGVERAIRAGTLESLLVRVPVRTGDAIWVPGGRIHAIGAGCLIFECQQNSNTTYRLYDWDRVGPDGKPRELHIDEGLKVARFTDREPVQLKPDGMRVLPGMRRSIVCTCTYFVVERWTIETDAAIPGDGGTFRVLHIVDGVLRVRTPGGQVEARRGVTVLVPADCHALGLVPVGGTVHAISAALP